MNISNLFSGPNAGYIEELYEQYLADPQAADEATRTLFAAWRPNFSSNGSTGSSANIAANRSASDQSADTLSSKTDVDAVVSVVNLANSIRSHGHLAAKIDPLGRPPLNDASLLTSTYGLTDEIMRQLPGSLISGHIGVESANALEAVERLRAIYSGTIGFDIDHINDAEQREWFRSAAESRTFHPSQETADLPNLLQRLTAVEAFEQFLHNTFQCIKRF